MNDNRYQFEKIKIMCVGRQKRERKVQTLLFYGEKFSAREPTNKGIEVRIKPNKKKFHFRCAIEGGEGRDE